MSAKITPNYASPWPLRMRILVVAATALCLISASLAAVQASADPFEIASLDGGAFNSAGVVETRAGSHPSMGMVEFHLKTVLVPTNIGNLKKPIGTLRDTFVDLPAGLIGNPQAVPACPANLGPDEQCPDNTQVGYVALFSHPFDDEASYYAVYNLKAPPGTAGLFRFIVERVPVSVEARLRTGGDYGISADVLNAPQTVTVYGASFVLWGVPADPIHDSDRGGPLNEPCASPTQPPSCSNPSTAAVKPFLSLPTSCVGPADTAVRLTTWENEEDTSAFTSPGNEQCDALDFSPSLKAQPTTNLADSPSGLNVDLRVPQNEELNGTAEAHLKDTTVILPEGMTVNPSAANGLAGCSPAEADLHGKEAAHCPDASKVGTVQVDTPLVDHPVMGSVYIAEPHENPFKSLLAIYIAIDDPQSGVIVKLAGEVQADPVTGQLKTTFVDNPQLPFEHFRLKFFDGDAAPLKTPAVCDTYTTMSSLTPWSAPDSGPPATPSDSFATDRGPSGSCASNANSLPSGPSFEAGTVSPVAGASSALVVSLRRDDGTQQFSSVTLTPPQGLVGKLAGIPYCPDSALTDAATKSGKAEEASPSCPAGSYVGSVTAAAGAGPAPYYASGKAFLAGPYKSAPLSLAIVTPATAGPFDLGTIVVRTALFVDRKTAQITAVSDPIPTILQGIPLDVRSIQVKLDRPDFTLNPTSCDPTSFAGQLMSVLGQTTPLQSRFQVGKCDQLGFKPNMTLRLKGGTARGKYPALTAVLTPRMGDANLANISVALPHSEFLAQEHIRTVCTRVQFAADQCPPAAIYGTATVTTPLLDYPLIGPVYLRSSDNPLPDLVTDLRGPANQPIKLEAAGRTDSIRGGIRNSFDFVPDAPFTKLVLKMQGGKKGLLVNSRNICKHTNRATVKFGAHNGLVYTARPMLRGHSCTRKGTKSKGRTHKRR